MTTLHLSLGERGYDIHVGRGILCRAGELFNLNRRVFIVTDDGVPGEYAQSVKTLCKNATVVTLPQGEDSKSPETFIYLLSRMLEFNMTRSDCVVAVGGGVIGDLAGFAAASYMRGVDFYNIPTTLLSQVDSSIGGKTAINLNGVKNIVGAFHQPSGVLIDLDTLNTLPKRHISSGMAEAIKMALTSDKELFELIEKSEQDDDLTERVVIGSLKIKKSVVEADEREGGVRKILNFGHTLGHAIEATNLGDLFHGECVALGMLVTSSDELTDRISSVLKKFELPTKYLGDAEELLPYIAYDKKSIGGELSVIFVNTPGSYVIKKMSVEAFQNLIKERLKK